MRLFKEFTKLTLLEKIFLLFLFLCQVYYSYRYIFRFGSSLSPKGYVLTPSFLQYGKFFLAVLFFLILLILVLRKIKLDEIIKVFSKNKAFWLLVFSFFSYIGISLFKFYLTLGDFGFTQIVKMLFIVPFVFFVPLIWKDKSPLSFLKIFLKISIVYHLVYNFFMITMFYLIGRMPGLGFAGILGRFGGGWDDPNSFGAFILLLIVILLALGSNFFKEKKLWAFNIISTLLVTSLIFTFSVTDLAGLILALIIMFILRALSFKKIIAIPVVSTVFLAIFYYLNYFGLILNEKTGSAKEHLSTGSIKAITSVPQDSLGLFLSFTFGLNQNIAFHENIYLQIFNNFGFIGLSLLLIIIILTIIKAFKGWLKATENSGNKIFFLVALVYLPTFALMNINLPLFQSFPLNLFIWVFISLVWVQALENPDNKKERGKGLYV